MGQRGRSDWLLSRASLWMSRMLPTALSSAAAIAWCMAACSCPQTYNGVQP